MTSIPAREVAKDVIAAVRNGEIPNLQKIQKKHGYSDYSAKSMKATMTKTYKKEIKNVLKALEDERDRLIASISGTDLSKEKLRDKIDAFDKIIKNYQLLSGGATENISTITPDLKQKMDSVIDVYIHGASSDPRQE